MPKITLITGGSRSGKSRHALSLAGNYHHKAFIATAEPLDEEMKLRILNHKRERGEEYLNVEEPLHIGQAIQSLPPEIEVAVLDCLTVWLGNLMFHRSGEKEIKEDIQPFLDLLKAPPCSLIIVTNEVGMGIVPEIQSARDYRDTAGWLNQKIAYLANEVILMVSGIAMTIKESKHA